MDYYVHISAAFHVDVQSTIEITYNKVIDTQVNRFFASCSWTGLPPSYEGVVGHLIDANVPSFIQCISAINCIQNYIADCVHQEREAMDSSLIPTIIIHTSTHEDSEDLHYHDWEAFYELNQSVFTYPDNSSSNDVRTRPHRANICAVSTESICCRIS